MLTEKVFLRVMGPLFALAAVAALVDPLAAASRISGMLIEQRGTEYHVAVAIFEVAMFGVSLWLYRRIVEREQRGLREC